MPSYALMLYITKGLIGKVDFSRQASGQFLHRPDAVCAIHSVEESISPKVNAHCTPQKGVQLNLYYNLQGSRFFLYFYTSFPANKMTAKNK